MNSKLRPFKRWIILASQITISVSLVWFAFRTVNLASLSDRILQLPKWVVVVVLALLTAQVVTATWRWCHVVKANRISLPFPAALRIFFVGFFFNQTLPSSVGGDVFRIWLLYRRGTTLGQATGSVMLDRIIGLEALLLTAFFGIPVLFTTVPGPAPWSFLGLSILGLTAFAVLLALGGTYGTVLDRWQLTRVIRNAARSLWWLVTNPIQGLTVLALSVSVHLMTVACIDLLLRGFGHAVPFTLLVTLVLPVLLVTVIPVSMAGWGVRENAMVFILGFAGIPAPDALATSLLFGIGIFLVGLPGGIIWLSGSGPRTASIEVDKSSDLS